MKPLNIGVVGCGNISATYFRNLARYSGARVLACADLDPQKATHAAAEHNIPLVLSTDDLLIHPDIDIVLNLTVPKAHAEISLRALRAGKHVYSEKPLAVRPQEGALIVQEATARGLYAGCAPDTFLGGSHQTCRDLLDSGAIGQPVGAAAFMLCHGHESWHPSPEFYYEPGGGPMMDMGPYYLTALANLFGPATSVSGAARITFPERTITSAPKYGKRIIVETPTHVAGMVSFASGAVASIVTSFDVWHSTLPRIEVWGTEGSMLVPDPNGFGGPVMLRTAGEPEWHEVPVQRGFISNSRGLGLVDMIEGIRYGRAHRASAKLALHVLEIMDGFLVSSEKGTHVAMEHGVPRPEPLPAGYITEENDVWQVSEGM